MSHRPDQLALPTFPTFRDATARSIAFTKRIRDGLLYSSAYLAVIAMLQVWVVMVLLGLDLSLAPVITGLIVFAVYAVDRISDADSDDISNPKQAAFSRKHGRLLYVLAAIAYGVATALSVFGGPLALGLTLLPGMVWIVYATDWIPGLDPSLSRLKDVFLLNSILVAGVWAFFLTFLPLAFAGRSFGVAAFFIFVYFFLGIFVNVEIPNVRDIDADRAVGVSTLPVVIGEKHTRAVLAGLDVGVFLSLAYATFIWELIPVVLFIPLAIGLVYSLSVTSLIGSHDRHDLLTIAAECEYVFVAVGIAGVWLI